ncbi:hypothetical protein BB561_004823 [Smittium simulii]|uniref:BRCT domain-containing protein n=1 Tax=Smittium simulii TaxID=133385 RepID=A0A2T9YE15_9FUNG|nr:hypothetical protein BB561_004823 [Smittium simulii]
MHKTTENNINQLFQNVVFWANLSSSIQNWDNILQDLLSKGAIAATALKKSNNTGKIKSPAIVVPPGLESEIYSFKFNWNIKNNPKDDFASNINALGVCPKENNPTHIFTNSIYFPEYLSAKRNGVKIVKPKWIEDSIRLNSLQPEEAYDPDVSKIFSGMIVTATQLPVNDREALYGGVIAYGGQYRQNLAKGVTHMVLLTGSGSKYQQILSNPQLNIKLILPHWFEQCINLGILIDDKPYLFPDPPIFLMLNNQPSAKVENKSIGKTEAEQTTNNDNLSCFKDCADITQVEKIFTETGMLNSLDSKNTKDKNSNFFLKNYNISLSLDLFKMLDSSLIDQIKESIEMAGGFFFYPSNNNCVTTSDNLNYSWSPTNFAKIDILICQYRSGCDYFAASILGKLVGSLIWLIKILRLEKIISPMNHVFDYPLPNNSILDVDPNTNKIKKYIVGISGYSGAAKLYLQRLITCMGASYVPQLSKNLHTHLIASNPSTIKFENAREWNCHVVNHLWLEKSFLEEKCLSVSYPHFTFWPPLSESALGNSVGSNNSIKLDVLERNFCSFDYTYQKLLSQSVSLNNTSHFNKLEPDDLQDDLISISNDNKFSIGDSSVEDLNLCDSIKMFIFLAASFSYKVSLDIPTLLDLNKLNSNSILFGSTINNTESNQDDLELKQIVNDTTDDDTDNLYLAQKRNPHFAKKFSNSNSLQIQMGAAIEFESKILSGSKSSKSNSCTSPAKDSNEEIVDSPLKNEDTFLTKKHTNNELYDFKNNIKKSKISISAADAQEVKNCDSKHNLNVGNKGDFIKVCDLSSGDHLKLTIVFTQGKPTDHEEEIIKKMGGHISTSIKNATYLISKGIKRTSKFLEAIAGGSVWIVSPNWLKDSMELKTWIDLSSEKPSDQIIQLFEKRNQKYLFQNLSPTKWWWDLGYGVSDNEVEKKYNFKMVDSFYISRQKKLFEGYIIYITPNVQPHLETLQSLIKSGFGTVKTGLSARSLKSLINSTDQIGGGLTEKFLTENSKIIKEESLETLKHSTSTVQPKKKLIVISCEQDRHLWLPFLSFGDTFKELNTKFEKNARNIRHEISEESENEHKELSIPIYSSDGQANKSALDKTKISQDAHIFRKSMLEMRSDLSSGLEIDLTEIVYNKSPRSSVATDANKKHKTIKEYFQTTIDGMKKAMPIILSFIALVFIMMIIPALSYEDLMLFKQALDYTKHKQELIPEILPVDPDTPDADRMWISSSGEKYQLVFSDEFTEEGRDFRPGKDKHWESQDLWYWSTQNIEYMTHNHTITKDGKLNIILDEYSTKPGLNFTGGMLNSWNKLCFQGGYMEARVSFPGKGNASGYWPAVWTLGNLGRAGFGATVDGLWPYSYNSCDSGVLPNQGNRYTSNLPGQRLNACVCSGDHPSPGIGRGAPEIDLLEAMVNGGVPSLSLSYHVAPFDFHHKFNKSGTHIYKYGLDKPGYSKPNTYVGDNMQQTISAVHFISPEVTKGRKYQVYGVEFEPGPNGFIQWYVDNEPVFRVDGLSVKSNKFSGISQRVIPEEPMYIIMNLSISKNFGFLDFENLEFPATMYVDYIRVYQQPGNIRLSCDPPDRPTKDYILSHPRAYFNYNYTMWNQTGYGLPAYNITNKCNG